MKTKFWHNTLMTLLVIFVLGLSSWAILGDVDSNQRITLFGIVGVVIAAITSVYSVSYSHQKAKEREIENFHMNELKVELQHFYNAFTESILHAKSNTKTTSSKKVENELIKFKQGLMNWGSERLINAFLKYDDVLTAQDDRIDLKYKVESANEFLREIRKELNFNDSKDLKVFNIILTTEARKELGGLLG